MKEEIDPLILAIETATRAGSFALCQGKRVLSFVVGDAEESHSTGLLERVEYILQSSGANLSDIDSYAVANGPGSFTGLRIGLATVKALAVCTGKKVIGVSTLTAIAHAAGDSPATLSLLPAGRGEVFAQLFSVSAASVSALDRAAHLSPQAVVEKYQHLTNLICAGEAANLHAETLLAANSNQLGERQWRVVELKESLAIAVAGLALRDFHAGVIQKPEELHASYVRPSDAEIQERWQPEQAPRSSQS